MPPPDGDDKGLTDAITTVKSVIDIPAEYSTFDYASYTNADGITVWSLNWSGEGGFIDASVDSDGTILSYYCNYYDRSTSAWANMTTAEAKAMAEDFIRRVDAPLYEKLVYTATNGYGANTTFTFAETADNIKLYNRHVTVRVDRVNKRVTHYSSNGATKKQTTGAEGLISEDEALRLYAEKIGAKIVYRKNYDYKSKTVSTYPVYVLNDTGRTAIGAASKEIISYMSSEGEGKYFATASGAANDAMAYMENTKEESRVEFTPEELAAIDAVSGLISREQADALLKAEFPELAGIELASASLNKDYYAQDKYYWNIRYRRDGAADDEKLGYLYASAKLDAKTGELLSWNYSDGKYEYETQVTEEQARKLAAEFIDKYAFEKFQLCGDIETDSYGSEDISYSFTAPRLANGAEVEGESVSLTVNPDGKITYFNVSFTDGLTFAPIDNAIDTEAAVRKIAEYGGFELMYVYTGEKYEPVYEIKSKYIAIDPITGEIHKEGVSAPVKPEKYNDLEGHWAKTTVETLLDNGYFLEGESFNPDAPITVKEFLTYAKFISEYEGEDSIKAYIARVEPEKTALADIDLNRTLTREIAAKYITADMGCAEIAGHSEIFVYPFGDAYAVSDNLIGHIAICYAEKIFNGDAMGNFNPAKQMTRAEAAAVIYNYYRE